MLSEIREKEGNLVLASELLQELQVETFGSMERREKVDFVLEQMRLLKVLEDWDKVAIVAKRINLKWLAEKDHEVSPAHSSHSISDAFETGPQTSILRVDDSLGIAIVEIPTSLQVLPTSLRHAEYRRGRIEVDASTEEYRLLCRPRAVR